MELRIKEAAKKRSVDAPLALTGAYVSVSVELQEIGARCAALPDILLGTAEEIIGYDAHGAPLLFKGDDFSQTDIPAALTT